MGRKAENTRGAARRAVTAAVMIIALAVAVAGYAAIAMRRGWGMPCLFRTLTGWQCPGCGMTHAVVALLRLDIRTAFACNALFPVYGAYCGWLTVSTARQYIRTGKPCFRHARSRCISYCWCLHWAMAYCGIPSETRQSPNHFSHSSRMRKRILYFVLPVSVMTPY